MLHDGKVALITGAASGIGRAAALAFAREGAKVAVVDINAEGGEETASAIRAVGREAIFVRADMLEPSDIAQSVAATINAFGRLDSAVNNAGHRGGSTTAVACDETEWDMVMGINVKAVWLCMKYQIPEMLKVGGGAIVNVSSGLGNFAAPNSAAYATSKHAVVGLTRSAAVDFGPHNIRVNALHPGATITPMLTPAAQGASVSLDLMAKRIPLRRLGRPEDQGEAAMWLCSDAAAFISGAGLIIDGGLSVLR